MSFLELDFDPTDFAGLLFRIENDADVLLERVFVDAAEVVAFFSSVLDVGDYDDAYLPGRAVLRFTLEMQNGGPESGLGTLFAVGTTIVPEPGTGILISLGLLILGSRRRRSVGRFDD